ncbi:MAG: hypothetical protein WBY47_06285, partial [Desulfobacterales bacterium]
MSRPQPQRKRVQATHDHTRRMIFSRTPFCLASGCVAMGYPPFLKRPIYGNQERYFVKPRMAFTMSWIASCMP